MNIEIDVTNAEILCLQESESDGFALMNIETKETWPISKAGMLALAQQLDKWFEQLTPTSEGDV